MKTPTLKDFLASFKTLAEKYQNQLSHSGFTPSAEKRFGEVLGNYVPEQIMFQNYSALPTERVFMMETGILLPPGNVFKAERRKSL